ncbi:MAG: dolichyl-phosphate-mannose-protein mannosyltransferase, partial [Mycobacteriales bacterium]
MAVTVEGTWLNTTPEPPPPDGPPDEPSGRPASRLERLRVPMPADSLASWLITFAVTLIAALIRFWGVGFPNEKVFDETYYATEAGEILRQGYESNIGYMFIVHPPLGKWLIAGGIKVFGDSTVGWRVPAALAGTLTVLLLVRIVRRMTRSTLLGAVAGLLLALDGLSVVLSRFALLDIFIALFVIAGFGCLVVDRDKVRERLARAVEAGMAAAAVPPAEAAAGTDGIASADRSGADGATHGGIGRVSVWRAPGLGSRPWRLAGGVLLGLSCAVKWSGIWFLLGFALLSLIWDYNARRSARLGRPLAVSAVRDLPGAALTLGVAPVAAYLLAWSGWFLGENSYGRHWADTHDEYWSWLPGPVRSLIHYHWEMWHFHKGLESPHPYQSTPWSWLVTGRPVLFYYPTKPAPTGCGSPSCVRSVLAVGTPALWWAFVPAVLWCGWLVLSRRDWRATVVLVAFAAGWLSWFLEPGRTMFIFYMAPLVPFLALGVTL